MTDIILLEIPNTPLKAGKNYINIQYRHYISRITGMYTNNIMFLRKFLDKTEITDDGIEY